MTVEASLDADSSSPMMWIGDLVRKILGSRVAVHGAVLAMGIIAGLGLMTWGIAGASASTTPTRTIPSATTTTTTPWGAPGTPSCYIKTLPQVLKNNPPPTLTKGNLARFIQATATWLKAVNAQTQALCTPAATTTTTMAPTTTTTVPPTTTTTTTVPPTTTTTTTVPPTTTTTAPPAPCLSPCKGGVLVLTTQQNSVKDWGYTQASGLLPGSPIDVCSDQFACQPTGQTVGSDGTYFAPTTDSGAMLPPTPCYTGVYLTAELPSGLGEIYSASVNNPNSSC